MLAGAGIGFAQSPCGPSGLTLAWNGTRLGDQFTLGLSGTPFVSGLVGADLAPGPVQTPVGLVCLGLTGATQFAPFALDAQGSFTASGIIPAIPAFAGLSAYLQAGALDATQPGGFALSNGTNP